MMSSEEGAFFHSISLGHQYDPRVSVSFIFLGWVPLEDFRYEICPLSPTEKPDMYCLRHRLRYDWAWHWLKVWFTLPFYNLSIEWKMIDDSPFHDKGSVGCVYEILLSIRSNALRHPTGVAESPHTCWDKTAAISLLPISNCHTDDSS